MNFLRYVWIFPGVRPLDDSWCMLCSATSMASAFLAHDGGRPRHRCFRSVCSATYLAPAAFIDALNSETRSSWLLVPADASTASRETCTGAARTLAGVGFKNLRS